MPADRRSPVIVGVGQTLQRPREGEAILSPNQLLAVAARAADEDASANRSLAAAADTYACVGALSRPYPDPGAFLARELGTAPQKTMATTTGGNSPQALVNFLAQEIARGEMNIALIGGAECIYSRRWARQREAELGWEFPEDPPTPNVIGDMKPGSSEYEIAHSATIPTQIYPIFESAIRAGAGRSIDEHQKIVSELWSTFSEVAATNPYAWTPTSYTAKEIRKITSDNRMVTFPYTKRMCANIQVDQAAALFLCSYEAAKELGVPDEKIVFLHTGADANDHQFFTERWSLDESPAIGALGREVFSKSGSSVDDIAYFDLYSCFPCAVQVGMKALGLKGPANGDKRPLTVTGGLAFAGGPGNNYVTHSVAAMVEQLRRDPGSLGLITALGWYITKHSIGLYSTEPPKNGYVPGDSEEAQREVDLSHKRDVAGVLETEAVVESSEVLCDRDGSPTLAVVTCLTPDGSRALANSNDPEIAKSFTAEDWAGRKVRLRPDGSTNRLEPIG